MRRDKRLPLLVPLVFLLGTAPLLADSIYFDGYGFQLFGPVTAVVNADTTLTLSQKPGSTGDVGMVLYTYSNYAAMTYVDNVNTNIDLSVECCAGAGTNPPDIRVVSGSEYLYAGTGSVSYAYFLQGSASSVVYSITGRTDGAVHTISNYKRSDGVVEESFDGATFTSSFLKDNNAVYPTSDVVIELQSLNGTTGNSVTIRSFSTNVPNAVPEPSSFALVASGCLAAGLLTLACRSLTSSV